MTCSGRKCINNKLWMNGQLRAFDPISEVYLQRAVINRLLNDGKPGDGVQFSLDAFEMCSKQRVEP